MMNDKTPKLLEAGEQSPAPEKIEFVFDFETIMDEMSVEEYIGMQRVLPEQCLPFLGRHVSDGKGGVLPLREGLAEVRKMSLADMARAAAAFFEKFAEHVLNPTRGASS